MNKEELDIYLRSYIGHEYSDLKEIVRYYNFQSIDDAITNIHNIQKRNYPIKEIDSLDTYFPKEFLFKKHGRFTAFAPHKHNWIELAYIYSGEISEIINGSSITLKTGDLIILDRNVIHSTDIAGFNDIMLSFILNIDYFNNSFFSQLMSSNVITNFLLHSLYEMHKYNTYLLFQTKDNEDIHNIICKLATEFISPNIGSDVIKDNYIKILFTELLRIYDSENNKENDINKNTQISFDI
ncbi:cupin domain-containing protein, partial [Clostridium saccharoperbutylacetonicum]